MNETVTEALRKVVDQSKTPGELSRRVVQSFGEGSLPQAHQLAAELKGLDWLRQDRSQTESPVATEQFNQTTSFAAFFNVMLRTPSHIIGAFGAIAILAAIAFPPFIVPLTEGLVNNAGFGFILSPPDAGSAIRAIVNVPLLAVIIVGLCAAISIALIVARGIESKLLTGFVGPCGALPHRS